MKIRTKLIGGFGIVVIIGSILGGVGLYSDKKLTSSSEDQLALSETRATVTSILISHFNWRQALYDTLYTGVAFTGSLDANTCSLGKWLASDEVKNMADPDELALIHSIVEPHIFIHSKAGEIVRHLENGEDDEAMRKFMDEALPKTMEVITDLEKMNDRYGDILKDQTHETYNLGVLFETIITIVLVIAIMASIILAFFITRAIIRPIFTVANALKDISQGEGDLTKTIVYKPFDEIGRMVHYFNQTLGKIKNLVLSIKKESRTLSDIGTDLASNMSQTAAAMHQINANIQSIKERVINQSASVTETNATMEQITVNIDKLNDHVERQAGSVSQSSSAIEEMLANIQSVTQTLIKNSENVEDLTGASEVGRSGLQTVASDIQEIARESEGLLEINSVMENISSQTNLLSMNAAIEAAHAGEAGRGFAVVAGEIRKLAASSSEQSKTISAVLKKIKASIDKITRSTDNVLMKFEAIDSGVRTVAEQEENIRNAMEEQGQGSKQVLQAIHQVNEITRMVEGGAVEMKEGSNEVIRESKNLEHTTHEITSGMNEMALGMDQINTAVHSVNDLCSRNRDGIDSLIREVSRFRVE